METLETGRTGVSIRKNENFFMTIELKNTDLAFTTSPDAGHPACVCSRCAGQISENELPVRVHPENETGHSVLNGIEYRFCENCFAGMATDAEEQVCRVCGCSDDDPCLHPDYGPCSWYEEDLCSHCVECPGESFRESKM